MSRETLLRTGRGLEVPLIPWPYCSYCMSPIAEKWAKLSGMCGYCAGRRKQVSHARMLEPLDPGGATFRADSSPRPFAFKKAIAVGLYVKDAPNKGEFGHLLLDFKYHGKGGSDLAEALDMVLQKRFSHLRFELLVPIPPEPGNERQAALVLARMLGSRRNSPVVEALSLASAYRSNKGALRGEKFNATKGQFGVHDQKKIADKDVALIDDVLTTGGHAHWAATALLEGGAKSVILLVLARSFDLEALDAIGYKGRF